MDKPTFTPLLATTLDEWKRRGWTPEFLASLKMNEGGEGAGGESGGEGGEGSGEGANGEGGESKAKAKPEPISFTPEQQAHIDGLISKSHGKAKSQAEAEFKKWLDQQAMGEADRLKAESADKDKAVEEARAEVLATRIETTAERLAIAAGVKPERVEKFLKLVDLKSDKLAEDGKPDKDAIQALIESELADAPEFKGAATTNGSGKSGGEFNGNGDGKVWTRSEIAKMSPAEYEKHEAEILKQLTAGGIK